MKVIFGIISIGLIYCIIIYVGYRPENVLMCKVATWILGESIITVFRSSLPQEVPTWMIYSLPGAIWCYSAFTTLGLALRRLDNRTTRLALAMTMVIPIGMEFFQYVGWTDGTYDPIDLLFVCLGGALGALTLVLVHQRSGLQMDWRWVMTFFMLILFFGDQWK